MADLSDVYAKKACAATRDDVDELRSILVTDATKALEVF